MASDYFATLKMPLVRGRVWSARDDGRAEGVTVINEVSGTLSLEGKIRDETLTLDGAAMWEFVHAG